MDPVITYETDEDEFLDASDQNPVVATLEPALVPGKVPCKRKNTARRDMVAPGRGGPKSGYDLAYFKLWWARMEIEGRKQAKEQHRLDDYNYKVTKGRKMYVNAKRNQSVTVMKDSASSQGVQNQRETPELQESLRVGLCFEGGTSSMGGGRGSPAPVNFSSIIYEQPRVSKPSNETDAGTGGYVIGDGSTLRVDLGSAEANY